MFDEKDVLKVANAFMRNWYRHNTNNYHNSMGFSETYECKYCDQEVYSDKTEPEGIKHKLDCPVLVCIDLLS